MVLKICKICVWNTKNGEWNRCQDQKCSHFSSFTKVPLVKADIFLFNIGKSKNKFDQINYDVLEKMKDGEAFASKYDSQQMKVRVLNVVMVFSNCPPNVKELAKVCFGVFNINNYQLEKKNIVEIKYP